MFSGLSFLAFGFIWLLFGHVSNICMAMFFLPLGIILITFSIWTGVKEYQHWKQYQVYKRTAAYASIIH